MRRGDGNIRREDVQGPVCQSRNGCRFGDGNIGNRHGPLGHQGEGSRVAASCQSPGGSSRKIRLRGRRWMTPISEPGQTVEEIAPLVEMEFKAVKVRIGQAPGRDLARLSAVRKAYGDDLVILTDANAAYTVDDARKVMPVMESLDIRGWKSRSPPMITTPTQWLRVRFQRPGPGRERVHAIRIPPHHRRRRNQHPSARCGESRRGDQGVRISTCLRPGNCRFIPMVAWPGWILAAGIRLLTWGTDNSSCLEIK